MVCPTWFSIHKLYFLPGARSCVFHVTLRKKKSIISLNIINWFVSTMTAVSIKGEVQTESLNIIQLNFAFQSVDTANLTF